MNRNMADPETSSQRRAVSTSLIKNKYAETAGVEYVSLPGWTSRFPVIFTPYLEKLVENGANSILVWHELSMQFTSFIHLWASRCLTLLKTGYQLYKIQKIGFLNPVRLFQGLRVVLSFSQEPKFPASVLLGLSFGLSFWGGGEGLLGVRQGREVRILCRAKPLH